MEIFSYFYVVCSFFQNQLFLKEKTNFQKYHLSVKLIGSKSGTMFCWARSGSKLFAKATSRHHKETKSKLVSNVLISVLFFSSKNPTTI